MNITGAFIAGFMLGEIFQLGAWKMAHPDATPWGYFKEGWGHWCINLTMVCVMGVLWWSEMLGPILGHLGFTPVAQLLSISPPFGFLLAFVTDIAGDKLAHGLTVYLSKKMPSGASSSPPLPPAAGPAEGTP
jgi:hypothetical protein